MLGGLNSYHFRILCDSPMNGGGGYLPSELGEMSLDQLMFRLCDSDLLKRKTRNNTEKLDSVSAACSMAPDKDGLFKGKTKDGKSIKGKIGGKSLNRILMEKAAAEKAGGSKKDRRRKRRRKK